MPEFKSLNIWKQLSQYEKFRKVNLELLYLKHTNKQINRNMEI
jgi:hypothetical protein